MDNNVQFLAHNNKGIDEIQRGEYDSAILSFTIALKLLRPCIPALLDPTPLDNGSSSSSSSSEDQHQEVRSSAILPNATSTHGEATPQIQADDDDIVNYHRYYVCNELDDSTSFGSFGTEFVFHHPIEISNHSVPVLGSTAAHHFFMKRSAVVTFNLALSFHLGATIQEEGQRTIQISSFLGLVRAKKLYESAWFQLHYLQEQNNSDTSILYSLALMNNLGLIYSVLCEHERSNHCFETMLTTMMFLLVSDQAQILQEWDELVWEGLVSNVGGYMEHRFCCLIVTVAPAA
jgi:hypothetical protein